MVIQEIANGSEVKIYASIGGHNIVLLTEAIFGVAAGLLVKPMEYFGKYMQFLEPSTVQIRNKRDGRVYKFMSTTITPVKTRYGNFHLIRCSSELEPENSRKAERFYIEKLGVFTINGNKNALKNCIIHDISLRGMAIILDNETKVKPGDELDIQCRYGATLHNYEVNAIAVRNFTIKDMPAVGCSIANMNVDFVSLVTIKRNEKYTHLDDVPATDLNPEISEKEQVMEVNEDIAKQLIPERKPSKPVSEVNPLDPAILEHVSREKSLREIKRDERIAKQTEAIENLLDLHDI